MTSIDISLASEWNWISVPTSQDISTQATSDLSFLWTAGDYFKNQTQFTEYYSSNGFFWTTTNNRISRRYD